MFLAKLGNLTSEVIFSIRLCVCLQSVGGSVRPVSCGRRLQEKWLVYDARNDRDMHPVSGATRDHAQRTSNGPRSIHTQVSGPGPFCWSWTLHSLTQSLHHSYASKWSWSILLVLDSLFGPTDHGCFDGSCKPS